MEAIGVGGFGGGVQPHELVVGGEHEALGGVGRLYTGQPAAGGELHGEHPALWDGGTNSFNHNIIIVLIELIIIVLVK